MTDAFDELLAEVRADLGTDEARRVDWDAVDAKLFARIEGRIDQDHRDERARFAPGRRRGPVVAAVALASAAAIVALLAGRTRESIDPGAMAQESAGTLVAVDGVSGAGQVLIDGKAASGGAGLALGDVIETGESSATIERPGKVTLTLEPGSRTVVTHVHGALILSLERGAVEAQVVPVAAGEAFAVDVDGSRVAVHGTHLRVAREGSHVVVDLNEGVVSVGPSPRSGDVLGTLVNAPAHVEFLATDVAGTLVQTHDPGAVRPPLPRRQPVAAVSAAPMAAIQGAPGALRPAAAPQAGAGEAHAETRPVSGTVAKPAAPLPELSPEETIARAVRGCMAERPRIDSVTVVVNTTLHLDLADDGSVRAARFEPPVVADVNACSAQAIYRGRFGHGGTLSIPIDFTN